MEPARSPQVPLAADAPLRARLGAAASSTSFRLGALVGVSALARFLVALLAPAPWIFPDEWVYSELARSLSDSGTFAVWGGAWPAWTSGPLYPLLLAPVYALAGSAEQAYVLVKAVNAVLMSFAAVPAYLLARRLVRPGLALYAALLAVLVPSMVYTSKVMTESLAYPLFLVTALALVRTLERPSAARQVGTLALVALCVLARAEMLVLAPLCLSAFALLALLDARAEGGLRGGRVLRRLDSYRLSWLAALGAALLAFALPLALGRSPLALLGAHEAVLHRLRVQSAPRWLLTQVAELDLAVGIVPFAAFLLVVVLTLRERTVARPTRIFVAVAVPAFTWFMALGALYATQPRPAPHVFERYVFYVMPFLFCALVLWIERGLPRPRRWTPALAALAFLLPGLLPFATLLNGNEWGVSSSTPALVPWALVSELVGKGAGMVVAVLVLAGLASALFLRVGAARESLVRFAVVANLWVVALVVAAADVQLSNLAAGEGGRASRGWVDAAAGPGAEVASLWTGAGGRGANSAYALLETQFFNRSVRTVYHLRAPLKVGVPSQPVAFRAGTLVHRAGPEAGRPLALEYVLVDDSLALAGEELARDPRAHLVLYRVDGSARLAR